MSSDYGYINARIRAMKSFLLKEEDYLEALRQNTPAEFISFLSRLPTFSNDIRQAQANLASEFVYEQALKVNLCRIFRKIIRFSAGAPQELIAILLKPWDIYNLKTIIRGLLSYKPQEEIIEALIPAGIWDLDFLEQLCKAKDLKALASALTACGASEELEFAQLIRDYSADTPLEILENNLSQAYFRKSGEYLKQGNANSRMVSDYLSLQIDFLNLLSVFKKIMQSSEPSLRSKLEFIAGGKLTERFLKDSITLSSPEDALKTFQNSPYPWLADEGLNLYKRSNRLSALERLFNHKLFIFCYNLYIRADPLSIGIPLAFINFKENEIRNLRLLGKAINFGMPYDLVREELIFAG